MIRRKTAEAADTAAAALIHAGRKIGSKKGERAANTAAAAILGRHYCPPNQPCRHCR